MKIIMGLLTVADSITAVGNIDGTVRHHLDLLSMEDSVLFLSHHIGDPGFVSLEIIPYLLHFVGRTALFHDRTAFDDTGSVFGSAGIQCGRIEVVFHIIGSKLHVSVCDAYVAVIVYETFSVTEIFNDRVFCDSKGRGFK